MTKSFNSFHKLSKAFYFIPRMPSTSFDIVALRIFGAGMGYILREIRIRIEWSAQATVELRGAQVLGRLERSRSEHPYEEWQDENSERD